LKLPDEPVQQFGALFDRNRGRVVVQRHGHRAGMGRQSKGGCRERSNRRIEFDGANFALFDVRQDNTQVARHAGRLAAIHRQKPVQRAKKPFQGGKDLHEDHAEPQTLHGGELPMQHAEHVPMIGPAVGSPVQIYHGDDIRRG